MPTILFSPSPGTLNLTSFFSDVAHTSTHSHAHTTHHRRYYFIPLIIVVVITLFFPSGKGTPDKKTTEDAHTHSPPRNELKSD